MIRFQDVSLRRGERMILSNIEFQARTGEHWIILGRNGSGKTTLLEMINGYLFPSSGSVTVLDNVYGQCDVREVRKSIGYISQSLMEKLNLADPVWEVVATGLYGFLRFYQDIPKAARELADEMLDRLQISHLRNSPLGVISQGERKKVMLARALMTNPQLMILDEPCSGLDLYEREKLLADLDMFRDNGIHLIYVTHHIEEIVPVFTHVLLIHEGKVLASGPKREVVNPETILRAYDVPVDVAWRHDRPWIQVV